MIDTHTHLYLPEFTDDGLGGAAAVDRAIEKGVRHMVMPNIDRESSTQLLALYDERPDVISTAWGLHPTEVGADWQKETDELLLLLDRKDAVAVGEVGIDLYWDKTYCDIQMQAFEYQASKARERGLPVIIHCREALDETLEVLDCFKGDMPEVVFHSFTGSPDDVEKIRRVTDAWFGINGVVTFKNARDLHSSIPSITPERIVLETDSPYLAPTPMRGKRNESSFLPYVCAKVAELTGKTSDEIDSITDRNARSIFKLDI